MKKTVLILAVLLASVVGTVSAEDFLMDLNVIFGYSGQTYPLHLYDNETAVAVARHVGSRDWQLPIVGFEGENSDVLQYYDVPKRYIIPSKPERVTSEKAGEVYYSHPNRLILFYQDAHVPGQYTKVGYFDVSRKFIEDVEDNPVLDGWGVMILKVKR